MILLFPVFVSPLPAPSLPACVLSRLSEKGLYCNTQVDIEARWGQDKTTSITTVPPQPTTTTTTAAAVQQKQQATGTTSQQPQQQPEPQTGATTTASHDLEMESQLSQILHQSEAASPPPSMAMTDSSLREVLDS